MKKRNLVVLFLSLVILLLAYFFADGGLPPAGQDSSSPEATVSDPSEPADPADSSDSSDQAGQSNQSGQADQGQDQEQDQDQGPDLADIADPTNPTGPTDSPDQDDQGARKDLGQDPKPEDEIGQDKGQDKGQTPGQDAGLEEGSEKEGQGEEEKEEGKTCSLTVRCDTILDNMDLLAQEKWELLPEDGLIYGPKEVSFYEGESVFNVLQRTLRQAGIHLEFVNTPLYNSAYIEGIHNLYAFDVGPLSGWTYKVGETFPQVGSSLRLLEEGDQVVWLYTCDLGRDVGSYGLQGEQP